MRLIIIRENTCIMYISHSKWNKSHYDVSTFFNIEDREKTRSIAISRARATLQVTTRKKSKEGPT